MGKKGAEQVMWIIIVIVLMLVTLVVLLTIFGKNIKPISQLNTCTGRNGICADQLPDGKCDAEHPIPALYDDCKDKKCCLSLGGA